MTNCERVTYVEKCMYLLKKVTMEGLLVCVYDMMYNCWKLRLGLPACVCVSE